MGILEPNSVTKLLDFSLVLEGHFFKYSKNVKSYPTELESIIWVLYACFF